jgi:predicted component of type VI protein secretion system
MLLVRLRLDPLCRLFSTHARRCLYAVLGVSAEATAADLKQAFKQASNTCSLPQPCDSSSYCALPAVHPIHPGRREPRSCTQTAMAARQRTLQTSWTWLLPMKPCQTPTSAPCMMLSASTASPTSCGGHTLAAGAAAAAAAAAAVAVGLLPRQLQVRRMRLLGLHTVDTSCTGQRSGDCSGILNMSAQRLQHCSHWQLLQQQVVWWGGSCRWCGQWC